MKIYNYHKNIFNFLGRKIYWIDFGEINKDSAVGN